ncbi:hypothetical protein DYB32_008499, partial [Aphanomyces invadans]
MSTLSPMKKRPADGSPDVSPDADQLVLSSPPKKPSKIPDSVKLKHEVIDLTGGDSDEEKPRTGVARNLSGSFKVGEPAPLVQGALYGRKIVEVPDPHPWEEDVKPPPAEDAFVLRTAREVSQRFAIIVHDVEYQQKAEALKFFQQVNEDRSKALSYTARRLTVEGSPSWVGLQCPDHGPGHRVSEVYKVWEVFASNAAFVVTGKSNWASAGFRSCIMTVGSAAHRDILPHLGPKLRLGLQPVHGANARGN